MNELALAALGVAAGILNTLTFIPYITAILRGSTKPQRATWWIWFILSAVGFVGQWAGGAQWSLVWAFSAVMGTGVVAGLSLKYGYGKFQRRDGLSLATAVFGVAISLLLRSPVIAVLTAVLINSVGASLTLYKTWLAPETEPLFAWVLSLAAATCGLLSVGRWQPAIFLSPLLNFVVNVLMVGVIVYRRHRVGRTRS